MGRMLMDYGQYDYDHEGYAAEVLDDGSLTGTPSGDTVPRMIGQMVAACGCGWTGATRYPSRNPFDHGAEDLALAEWERAHARPTLEGARVDTWDRLGAVLSTAPLLSTSGQEFTALPRDEQLVVRAETLAGLRQATEL